MKRFAYRDTAVPVERSQKAIRDLLQGAAMIEGGYFHSCFPECSDCKVTRLEKEVQQFRLVSANSRALAAEVAKLLEVASAARPFLNLKDKGQYVLGVITQSDITRLEEALEKVGGKEGKNAAPSA